MSKKWSICVDFDGVIHSYTSPWVSKHVIPDPPVEGSIEWLADMLQHFDVWILSTRTKSWRGRRAIRKWLSKWSGNLYYETMGHRGIEDVRLTSTKPPALIYLDDRAVRFEGDNFPTKGQIHQAKPWHKS